MVTENANWLYGDAREYLALLEDQGTITKERMPDGRVRITLPARDAGALDEVLGLWYDNAHDMTRDDGDDEWPEHACLMSSLDRYFNAPTDS